MLEIIYKEYSALMYQIANEILNNTYDAEDAVHLAFIKLAENIKKIDEPVSPKTKSFALTIVRNKAIDIYRAKARHPEVPLTEETVILQIDYNTPVCLAHCFAQLTPRYRKILLLKYIDGFSNMEIMKIMDLSMSNVYKLEQRARAKLLKLCENDGLL